VEEEKTREFTDVVSMNSPPPGFIHTPIVKEETEEFPRDSEPASPAGSFDQSAYNLLAKPTIISVSSVVDDSQSLLVQDFSECIYDNDASIVNEDEARPAPRNPQSYKIVPIVDEDLEAI
jgi:hypothetical protein